MKSITPPLKNGDIGPDVRNLQDGPLLLIVGQQALRFGSNTQKAVTLFQQLHEVNQTGDVDAPTADIINNVLERKIGALRSDSGDLERMAF